MSRSKRRWLIAIVLIGAYIAIAAAPCLGADWQFNEFSKSFNKNLTRHDSTATAYFYLGLILILISFVGYSYLRAEQNKKQIQTRRKKQTAQKQKALADDQQRREWLRVFSMIDCSYILDTPESNKQLIKTRMLDLGAGGCKLEVSELMETGDPVKVAFTLTADDTMAMNGTVIRVLDPKKEGDPYQVAIQFLDVKEGERDQIVRWAYKHELNINEEKKRLSEGLCLGCGKPLQQDPDGEKQTYCVKCTVYGKR